MVPNLGVGTPTKGRKTNLRGSQDDELDRKATKDRIMFIFSDCPLKKYSNKTRSLVELVISSDKGSQVDIG